MAISRVEENSIRCGLYLTSDVTLNDDGYSQNIKHKLIIITN